MTVTRRAALTTAGSSALAAGLTFASASAGVAASPSPTATPTPPPAPASPYPLSLRHMPLHDPFIVTDAETGLYHLFTANHASMTGVDAVGTMVYRSPDLQHWAEPVVVFQVSSDLWGVHGGWAPEVHRWRGRWYLFTTLHDPDKPLPLPKPNGYGLPAQLPQYQRGTVIAVSDSLLGPFTVLDPTRPVAPETFMTLDGTLFVDHEKKPWMVYAHEWLQKIDGTMEAVPLKPDLSGAAGAPIHLFKGSDPDWISEEIPAPSAAQIIPYVTDGPELVHLPGGALAMLWSTYEKNITNPNGMVTGHYVQTYAVSHSGKLRGPWTQKRPLLRRDSGHGMIFHTLPTPHAPSRPMLVVHRPFANARGKLYEIELLRGGLRLGKQRTDLDGGG